MPPLIGPGTFGWASATPGFNPPTKQHPAVIVANYDNGNIGVGFVTHSRDRYRGAIRLRRLATASSPDSVAVPSAFREKGGPLTDEDSVLGVLDGDGYACIAAGTPLSTSTLRIGPALVALSFIARLPAAEWAPLQARIRYHIDRRRR